MASLECNQAEVLSMLKSLESPTCSRTATAASSSSFVSTCSATGALGRPGARTISPSSSPRSSDTRWLSMWPCPRAQCQAPPSCWFLKSTTTSFSLSASSVTSTQAAKSCSLLTAIGCLHASSTSDFSRQRSQQRWKGNNVQSCQSKLPRATAFAARTKVEASSAVESTEKTTASPPTLPARRALDTNASASAPARTPSRQPVVMAQQPPWALPPELTAPLVIPEAPLNSSGRRVRCSRRQLLTTPPPKAPMN